MAFRIEWTPAYSIHDSTIDKEHQRLFSLVNDLLSIEDPQRDFQRFKADVKGLFRYMEYHFHHEEELMGRINYPDCEDHAKRHDKIISIMNGLMHNCVTLAELAEKLRDFVRLWLLKHVVGEDTKLTAWVDQAAAATANA